MYQDYESKGGKIERPVGCKTTEDWLLDTIDVRELLKTLGSGKASLCCKAAALPLDCHISLFFHQLDYVQREAELASLPTHCSVLKHVSLRQVCGTSTWSKSAPGRAVRPRAVG